MKIILSPSKLQCARAPILASCDLFNKEKTETLYAKLTAMSIPEIKAHFKLSDDKDKALYDMYQNDEGEVFAPFEMYTGVAFKEISTASYDEVQRAYLKAHGVILSALYGVIEADMGIKPYRLDFTKKLDGMNLYSFWQEDVLAYFKDEDVVINLASGEFSKMLKGYPSKMINIHFKVEKPDGSLKVVSSSAKTMRGMMFNAMCEQCIEDVEALKRFAENGYAFAEHLSDDANFVFVRK